MPSSHKRIQVTVDPELAAAMEEVDPKPASRSRQIRDLAIRGAQAERELQERRREAIGYLLRISSGEVDYDFDALREIYAEREAGFD